MHAPNYALISNHIIERKLYNKAHSKMVTQFTFQITTVIKY